MEFVIEHLQKSYEKKAVLRDIDFRFQSGRIYGLLGRNGAGLAALLYASGGTDEPLNYAVIFFSVVFMSIFFSVHYLMLYYLLRPYNAATELKAAAIR